MNNNLKLLTLLLGIASWFAISCKRQPTTIHETLANTAFPVFGAESFTGNNEKIGTRRAPGGVLSNVSILNSVREVISTAPKLVIVPEEVLVRELMTNELSKLSLDRLQPNIPIFFLKREKFRFLQLDQNGSIEKEWQVSLQNIKLVRRPNWTLHVNHDSSEMSKQNLHGGAITNLLVGGFCLVTLWVTQGCGSNLRDSEIRRAKATFERYRQERLQTNYAAAYRLTTVYGYQKGSLEYFRATFPTFTNSYYDVDDPQTKVKLKGDIALIYFRVSPRIRHILQMHRTNGNWFVSEEFSGIENL